jgi:hypothetical protein
LSASQLNFSLKTIKSKLNMSMASFIQKNQNQESVIVPQSKDDILHSSRLSPFSFYGLTSAALTPLLGSGVVAL